MTIEFCFLFSTGFYYGQIEGILEHLKLELLKLLQSPLYIGNQEYTAVPDITFSDLIWACQNGEISTEQGCGKPFHRAKEGSLIQNLFNILAHL